MKKTEKELSDERHKSETLSAENAELKSKVQTIENLSIKYVELVRKAEEFSAQNAELADQVLRAALTFKGGGGGCL